MPPPWANSPEQTQSPPTWPNDEGPSRSWLQLFSTHRSGYEDFKLAIFADKFGHASFLFTQIGSEELQEASQAVLGSTFQGYGLIYCLPLQK